MSLREERSDMQGKPIDWEALQRRCMGRAELAERIVLQFCEGLDERLVELREAMESGNRDEIARLAHRLKGTSLTVSAEELAGWTRRIEEAALRGELDQMDALFAALREARERLPGSMTQPRTEAAPCGM